MNESAIHEIMDGGHYPGRIGAELLETHISWVILTPEFAFKIKKPVRLDFLDFSTPEKRKFYCEEELRLNRRLAPDLYLKVLPIAVEAGHPAIGSTAHPIMDYTVQMRRFDNNLEMDRLLEAGQVTPADMQHLADLLAPFHLTHRITAPEKYRPENDRADFNAVFELKTDLLKLLGENALPRILQLEHQINAWITLHSARLLTRAKEGFWIDGHGDLHTRNIFIDGKPVVFDCIEFNPHFRMVDVLSELAFLCMDLEYFGRPDLADIFLEAYRKQWDFMPEPEDARIFGYFKAYRANVRLKVTLLALQQHRQAALEMAGKKYWDLLARYCGALN
jgi:hypothetical protein